MKHTCAHTYSVAQATMLIINRAKISERRRYEIFALFMISVVACATAYV